MLFLLQQLWWLLPLAALMAGVAGWRLHLILSAPRLRELERERNRLRAEFEGYMSGERIGGLRKATDERELAFLRTRESIAGARVVELDRALVEVREQRDAHAGRAAELERALDAATAEKAAANGRGQAAEAELARLRAESNADEMNALGWRLRYFEARTRYLERHAAAAAPGEDAEALERERDVARAEARDLHARNLAQLETSRQAASAAAALTAERDAARAELEELRVRAEASLEANGKDALATAALKAERDAARAEAEDLRTRMEAQLGSNRDAVEALKWRARYLESRVRVLASRQYAAATDQAGAEPAVAGETAQGAAPAAEAGQDEAQEEEAGQRRLWRMRYLEARLRHAASAAAPPMEDGETRRLKWRARYLDARVQHLERQLAGSPPSQAIAAPEATLPIETPPGAEVRPVGSPAPREGAPDDLMLINGMSPQTESALHALGVYHFDQIADWSHANVAWLDQYLRMRGRISREQWVEQARVLVHGAPGSRRLYYETETA